MKYVVVVERWGLRWYYAARPSDSGFLRKDGVHPDLIAAKRYSTKEFAERAAFKLAVLLMSESCYVESLADAEKWERKRETNRPHDYNR